MFLNSCRHCFPYVMAVLLCLCVIPSAKASEKTSTPVWEEFDGSVVFSLGDSIELDGSKSAMQRKLQRPDSAIGGIEEFTFAGYVADVWELKGRGRAVLGIDDYELAFQLKNSDGLYLDFDFDRYRVFYNGDGAYLPVIDSFYSLVDPELYVDRQFFTFELGHDGLEFGKVYLRYTYHSRDGSKDSTIWGDVAVPGLGPRSVIPSLLLLDEERQRVELGVSLEGEQTEAMGWVSYESSKYKNSTRIMSGDGTQKVTQDETSNSNLFTAVATARHEFNEDTIMTTAASFSEMNSDFSGNRIFGSDFGVPFDPLFLNYGSRDAAFLDLMSATDWSQYTYNLNLLYTPNEKLTLVPSIRLEKVIQDSTTAYRGEQFYRRDYAGNTDDQFGRLEGELEMRYRVSPKTFLYARGLVALESGDMGEFLRAEELQPTSRRGTALDYDADYDRRTLKLVSGGDVKLRDRLHLNVQGYVKEQLNEYDVLRDTKNLDEQGRNFNLIPRGEYPGYVRSHRRQTLGTNARLTWRPKTNLSSVTRVDYQWIPTYISEFDSPRFGSAKGRYFSVTETITWIALSKYPVQLHGGYVGNEVETPGSTFFRNSNSPEPNLEVLTSENGYWHTGIHTTLDLPNQAVLELGYDVFRSDNYTDNSVFSVPYGSDLKEHLARIRYAIWLQENIQWSLEGTAVHSTDNASGGNNDFNAYIISTGIRCKY